jgi:hypothetical protein
MSPAAIAQLAIILAPLVKDLVVEGSKLAATFKEDISRDDLNKALELSKSSSWPDLTFGQQG